jgi:gamma-glutamylcyclotransferase (GGCT)/AIG2-like uncharacterized protein YtfP
MRDLLFAYGTLIPLEEERRASQGWLPDAVRGRLFDLGSYPGLIDLDEPDAGWVPGYVRSVERDELEGPLDRYEGVHIGLYRRVRTTTRDNRRVWVYVYGRPLPADARGPLGRWQPPAGAPTSSIVAFGPGDYDVGNFDSEEAKA